MIRLAPQIEFALRASIFEGSMFAVYWNIVAGVIINGLFIALGASPLQLAILNAIPFLSQIVGLPAAKLIQTRDIRKPFCLTTEGISRGLWILVPLAVIFIDEDQVSIWFILFLITVAQFTHWGGVVSWLSWISDIVPEEIRGFYFGIRNSITGLVGLIGLTIASMWADKIKAEFGPSVEYVNSLLILIGISVVFAGMSWIGLYFQPARKLRNLVTTGYKAIWETLSTPNGKKIAITWVFFTFATGMGVVNMPFLLEQLKISFVGVTAMIWVFLLISSITTPLWGRFSDIYGYKPVLVIGWVGVFWQPFIYALTPYDMPHMLGIAPWPILFDAVVGGIFWPAMFIAQNNIVIGQAPSQTRAGLYAALSAMTGAAGFVAGCIAGNIAQYMGDTRFVEIGSFSFGNYQFPMIIGALLRFLCGIFVLTIEEPPRLKHAATSAQAFSVMWRLLLRRPG